MAYNITFRAKTLGTESVEGLRAKVLLMQQQYKTAGDEVKKSVKSILDAQKEADQAAAAGNQSRARSQAAAAATERAALDGLIAKERELKVALDEASRSTVASTMQARAAVQALEGNLSTIGAGRWLASIQGLGPAISAAFNVIGPLAFLAVLGTMVEKIYALYTSVRDAKERIGGEFKEINRSVAEANDTLRVTNDRLADDIAKLEHKPENQLRIALDEAALAADELADSLSGDINKLEELLKKNNVGVFKGFFTGQASTTDIQKEIGGETGFGGFRGRVADITDEGRAKIQAAAAIKDKDAALMAKEAAQTELNTRLTKAYADEIARLAKMMDAAQIKQGKGQAPSYQAYVKNPSAYAPYGAQSGQDDQTSRIEELKGSIRDLSEEKSGIGLEGDKASLQAKKNDLDEKNKIAERTREAAHQTEERRRTIEEFGRKELNPVEAIYARRDEAAKRNKFTPAERNELDAGAERDVQAELKKQTAAIGKDQLSKDTPADVGRVGYWSADGSRAQDSGNFSLIPEHQGAKADGLSQEVESSLKRAGELIVSSIKEYNTEHNKSVNESGAEAVRSNASRGAFADRMTGLNPQLSDAQKIAEIHKQDLATAQEKYRLESQTASELATAAEQEDAHHKADLSNEIELQNIKERNIEQLAELQNKQLENYSNAVGKLFDALASRRPGAITDVLRSEVLSIGKTITENLAKEIWPTIQKAIPHAAGGSQLGKMLSGTTFGPNPLKVATDANTVATQANTAEMMRGGGGPGGSIPTVPGGGVPGWGTTPGSGTDASSTDLNFPGTGTGPGPAPGSSSTTLGFPAGGTQTPGFGMNAGTIGTVAAAGAGAFAAISGFKKGGAGGALQGASAILGTAAMFDPEPISKAVLAGAAIVTGLISGFVNGPQKRANTINNELGQAQYIAPTAMNVTQSSGGTYADFDAKGNLRTSNFSPYPVVSQGYTWEQTHGLFGGPPTYYPVPGGQKSQFGAPEPPPSQVVHNHYNVQAIDTQSFDDALMKHHAGVGNAAAKNLQQTHGSLAAEIDGRIGR